MYIEDLANKSNSHWVELSSMHVLMIAVCTRILQMPYAGITIIFHVIRVSNVHSLVTRMKELQSIISTSFIGQVIASHNL